jgi:hypothetical protein
MSKLETKQNPIVEKLARTLLATTCLTAASGAAMASTILESTFAPMGDFSNSSPGTLLPVGTTVVEGSLPDGDVDYFEFQGLAPATPFSVYATKTIVGNGVEGPIVGVFDSAQNVFGSVWVEGGTTIYGSVPSDGNLVVEFSNSEGGRDYTATLTAQVQSPEPSTLATAGLALAGALVWRRKRIAKS